MLATPPSIEVTTATTTNDSLPEPLELESLLGNLDASLRVHTRHQVFTWTQGLLQNLIRHEVLLCALRNREPLMFHVDPLAAPPVDPAPFSDMFHRDTALVPRLMRAWEDNAFRPVFFEGGSTSQFAQTPLARELTRIGATDVLMHGTCDVFGQVASVYIFACKPETLGRKQAYFAELVVPFLQLAWVRSQLSRAAGEGVAVTPTTALLTTREQEILRWIHLGKSNIEIGGILGISPLTVKNHVQKILRKLNVQNRAQAVGRGLALRILSM